MPGHRFVVTGDPAMARNTVYSLLGSQGFAVTPIDDWSAQAERGSAGASIALGAFAGKASRHVKLHITCTSAPDGFAITLVQGTSGFSGGVLGKTQADQVYGDVYNAVGATFQNAGVLVSGGRLD